MARFTSPDLRREIRALLDRDPDISAASAIRELRAGGFSGGNVRLRVLVQIERENPSSILEFQVGGFGRERRAATLREFGYSFNSRLDATHIAITWVANYDAVILFYGQQIESVSGRATGRIVQPLDSYDRDLIEVRIEKQIFGQIVAKIGSGSETFIEGVDVELRRLDVSISNAELRGRVARRPGETTLG